MSLFNEYIILFRNLLKLVYTLVDFRIVLILELAPSIGPLERRLPWYLMKEFLFGPVNYFRVQGKRPIKKYRETLKFFIGIHRP